MTSLSTTKTATEEEVRTLTYLLQLSQKLLFRLHIKKKRSNCCWHYWENRLLVFLHGAITFCSIPLHFSAIGVIWVTVYVSMAQVGVYCVDFWPETKSSRASQNFTGVIIVIFVQLEMICQLLFWMFFYVVRRQGNVFNLSVRSPLWFYSLRIVKSQGCLFATHSKLSSGRLAFDWKVFLLKDDKAWRLSLNSTPNRWTSFKCL